MARSDQWKLAEYQRTEAADRHFGLRKILREVNERKPEPA